MADRACDVPPVSLSIVHLVAADAAGGPENVVRALASGHIRHGHAVRVVAVLDEREELHPWLDAISSDGVEIVPLRVSRRAFLGVRAAIGALCRELTPSVVHSHGYRSDVVGAAGARLAGIPTVSTVYGFPGHGWKKRAYEHLQCRALRSFDAVVSVSMPLVGRLAERGVPRDRLHIIPNAYDGRMTYLAPDEARRELGVPTDRLHIGWIGDLGSHGGSETLVRAVHLLAERNLMVTMIGEGTEQRRVERVIRSLDLQDVCRLHGAMAGASRLIRGFDVLVVTSHVDGTPIVLLEAMAAGVPLVAFRTGGVPDVVTTREALLVPPGQPELLASAIAATLRSPKSAVARAARASARLAVAGALPQWLRRYEELYLDLHRTAEQAERIAI